MSKMIYSGYFFNLVYTDCKHFPFIFKIDYNREDKGVWVFRYRGERLNYK